MTMITIDGITIEVQRKKMKHMTLRICPPDGRVKISAPIRTSDLSIRRFALNHMPWIVKHQSAYQTNPLTQLAQYVTGESHYLYGREYMLRVHEGHRKPRFSLTDDKFIDLYVSDNATGVEREKTFMKGYRALLLSNLPELITKWEQVVGVKTKELQVRQMKSRWGSCHPVKGKITLNLALIKYPLVCLEYVIVHELVHLLEASHNARFKALMDTFLPDWRTYKALLMMF